MKKVLVFDIWSEYGHFKKPYTTTSPLTFSIPSRTALTGIVGAILGIEKGKNNTELNYSKCNMSVRILSPIKKVVINQNLIITKTAKLMSRIKPIGGRTQIRFEKLKNPKYRIYIEIFHERLHNELKTSLVDHLAEYTPCMGLTEDIINFNFVGEYSYKEKRGEVSIDSVVSLEGIDADKLEFEGEKEYFVDNYPLEMAEDREVLKYGEIIVERKGRGIKINDKDYIDIDNGEKILWL